MHGNAGSAIFGFGCGGRVQLTPDRGGKIRRKKGGDRASPGGLYSSEYGELIENITIFVEYRISLPCELRHQIKILSDTDEIDDRTCT